MLMVIGFNPALQKTLVFGSIEMEGVNRASSVAFGIGGKGQNVSVALRVSSVGELETKLYQFVGGHNGQSLVRHLEAMSIHHVSVLVESETRMCTTLLAKGGMTELIEPSGLISLIERKTMETHIQADIVKTRGIALCGSVPPGLDGMYAWIAGLKPKGCLLLMDSLDLGCLSSGCVDILKVNADEVGRLYSLCFELDRKDDLIAQGRYLYDTFKLKYLGITNGPETAFLLHPNGLTRFTLPPLHLFQEEKSLNPLGAGDTCNAVFLKLLLQGSDPIKAFSSGLAAASASCLSHQSGVYSLDLFDRILPCIVAL